MKKYLIIFLLIFAYLSLGQVAKAQITQPPLPISSEPTATPTATATPFVSTTESTATATPTTTTQEYVDDAETGSEIIVLMILSVVGGMGLFFIKKHFDLKKYSL